MKLLYILIFLTTPMVSQAGIYKWVDKNGNTQYSQSPPDKSAKEMNLPPNSVNPKEREATKERIKNQQKFLKALNEEKQAKKKIDEENRRKLQDKKDYEKYCKELRNELRDMEIGGIAWYKIDNKGERRFLSEEDIVKEKQMAREKIKKECDGQAK